ncbi:MAG: DsbA family protein, partial [Pseudomonadota bacterium]
AARVALAAKSQGKYWDVHRALLAIDGRVDGKSAMAAAEKLGLDMAKLKADMTSDDVNGEISSVRELAQKMGINGTPHFLVGERTIAGAPEDLLEQFKTNVADIRKNGGCKVC